ncbi:tail associated lysin [Bacillus phage AvesoBmore]|uniref:Tape measure protein n=1 Tax=Bacillus phage AvesoBmore TaxID=1698451 RepID=A0A0K2D0C6_9CAUD|nr:tail associated lysin [Bacillus phage AvesoBmore]ALA13284.1 tape measure protein [Bacillus phage AvesoBmore]
MANKETFIFDVNADIEKAMKGLNKVKQAMDDIDRLQKKGESRGNTTNESDILNSMKHAKQAAQEYKKLQSMLKDLDKSLKGSNQRMFKDNDSERMKKVTGVDMKSKQDYQKFVQAQRRELDRTYTKAMNAQQKMARFGQTHTKNFSTNYQQKGIMHVDTKNLDEAKKTVKGILSDINASSGQLDNVLQQIREAKKLDRRSESLARRASASGYMSHQQASNFTKDYQTVNGSYKNSKDANLNRLTEISTQLTDFAKQLNTIESNPNATNKDMQQRVKLQNNIRALDQEWTARTKLNKILETTTSNMQSYHESLVGTKQKADRNTVQGMISERAPAIGMAVTGAVGATIGGLYSKGGALSKEMRPSEVYIGQQTGMDGSNWRTDIRNNAMTAGKANKLGFLGTDMLAFQENYLTARGNTGRKDLQDAMSGQATFSRSTGISAQDTQQFFDTAYRSGGVTGSSTKQFQNAFLGAIKQSGMEGREKDQLKALDGILQGMTQGRSITNQDMMQTMGLQAALANSGVSALQGSKGGQALAGLDEGIRNGFGDASVRVAFGQGTEYQGVEGRWKLRQEMEKGVASPEIVNKMAGIAKAAGGGNKEREYEAFASFANERLGAKLTTQQVQGIMDEYNKGNLSQENISKIMEKNQTEGEKESKKRLSNYQKSSAATDSQSEATTAEQAVKINDMGEAVREANIALGGLPAPLYGAVLAVGAFTASMLAAAASFGLAGVIKNKSLGTYGGGGGGAGGGTVTPGGGIGGRPPSGGVGTGAGANIPPGYGTSSGGVIVPESAIPPTTPAIPGGATRQYSQGGVGNWFKGLFDPSARAGGLANFGTGEAIAGGAAVAGGAAAAANANKFPNLFKGGLKGSVAFKGLNKILLPLAALTAVSSISSAESEDKGKATGSAIGGIGGGILGGAAAGAAAGSIIPGAGTLVGGAIGLTGGIIGSIFGSNIGESIGGWFDPEKGKEKSIAPEAPKSSPSSDVPAATNTSTSGATPMATSMAYSPDSQMPTNMPNTAGNPNAIKDLVDKENTNTKQRTEMKKTDNLSYERENLTLYEKALQKAESLLAQARAQNGIMGNAAGGGAAGGANGINGFTGGGSLKFLADGQKWSNSNVTQHDLGSTDAKLTAEDLDAWINSKAPKDSMMRGMGATFLKAGQETGLDPRYLVAHAAEESAWGTSKIARDKGNFFGIGAFDDSPYSSAFEFKNGGGSAAENGIMGGAKWIAEKYYGKGRTTLDAMHKAGYATNSDWASNIASIMKGAPTGSGSGAMTATINVNVKGDEKVSDKLKSSSDMKKVGKDMADMLGFYSKEMVMA